MEDSLGLLPFLSEEGDMEVDTVQSSTSVKDTTYPSLKLHLSNSCTCDCFLMTDTSPCLAPTEDELASILDDNVDMVCYEDDSFLYEILDQMSLAANDLTEPIASPSADSVDRILEEGFSDGESLIDFLCDPYIGGDLTSYDSVDSPDQSLSSSLDCLFGSVSSSSSSSADSPDQSLPSSHLQASVSSTDSIDFDIQICSQERLSHQKRKRSCDSSHCKPKRSCGENNLFSTLKKIARHPSVSDEEELRYGFYISEDM
ncbi:uncharacterized protein [Argopecten irradians]|uniref:uncharacterized protein n=1 Tax=Argopecten irradians TaxID=31199 RepID=UPI00371FEE43